MTYVGATPTTGDFKKLDAITASATATYNLRQGGVAVYPQSSSHCLVVLNGILQTGGSSFNIVNDTIVFAEALTSSDVINQILVLGNVNDIGVPSSGSVGISQLSATGTKSSSTFLAGDNSFKSLTTNATHTGEVTGSGALTVADNIIDEANLKVSNSPTNGYFLSAQSGNTGGLTWAEPSGGAMVLLQSASATGTVSSISFNSVFSDTYTNYYFVFWNVLHGINHQPFHLRFKDTSNGVLSASVYDWVLSGYNASGSDSNNSAQDDSSIQLGKNQSGTAGPTNGKGAYHGVIYAPKVTSYNSSDNRPTINWQGAYSRSDVLNSVSGSGVFDNGTSVGGIQVYGGAGGGPSTYLDRFEGKIYGIVDS